MSTIEGKVHIPGDSSPQDHPRVELLNLKKSAQRLYTSIVDQEGNYLLKEVNEGSYLLFSAAWGTGSRCYWEIPVKVGADEAIKIDLLAETAQVLK